MASTTANKREAGMLALSLRAGRISDSIGALRQRILETGDRDAARRLDVAISNVDAVRSRLVAILPEAKSSPMSFSLSVDMLARLRREASGGSKNQSLVLREAVTGFLDTHDGPLPAETESAWDARISTRLPVVLLGRIHARAVENGVTKSVVLRLALADLFARRDRT